jgi:hypothetical protein
VQQARRPLISGDPFGAGPADSKMMKLQSAKADVGRRKTRPSILTTADDASVLDGPSKGEKATKRAKKG